MSIEAMKDSFFTEKSDVWSFGITVWEMMTLGSTPYCAIPAEDLEKYLTDGNRLKFSELIPIDISDFCSTLWSERPSERPKFSEIITILEEILKNDVSIHVLNDSVIRRDSITPLIDSGIENTPLLYQN